jgi:hypothetical protein
MIPVVNAGGGVLEVASVLIQAAGGGCGAFSSGAAMPAFPAMVEPGQKVAVPIAFLAGPSAGTASASV